MLGRINCQQVHQFLRLNIVVLNQRLHRVPILLRAHMLVSREISHDVKTLLFTEDTLKDGICKVQCIAAELIRHIQPLGRAHITYQLSQPVLVQIHHNNRSRLKPQHRLDETGTNTSRSTNHTNLLALYLLRQFLRIRLDIILKHALRSKSHRIRYKFL